MNYAKASSRPNVLSCKILVMLLLLSYLAGCRGIRGYEIVAAQQHAAILPGEVLRLEVLCPNGKHVLGGGGHAQSVPVGSAANYTLKASETANLTPGESLPRRATGWSAIWTNSTDFAHPQVVTFTVEAVCAYTD